MSKNFQHYLSEYKKALQAFVSIFYSGIPLFDPEAIEEQAGYPIFSNLEASITNLDIITKQCCIPAFRYVFSYAVNLDKFDPLLEEKEIAKSIILSFESYLAQLRKDGVWSGVALQRIKIEMCEQEDKYLQKYGSRLTALTESESKQNISLKEETVREYIFRKDGERWYIQFEDEVIKPENLYGLRYIHYLIENDKDSFKPKELYQTVIGTKIPNKGEEDSVRTYTVDPKKIEKAQLGELKEHHTNTEAAAQKNVLEQTNKREIRKLVKLLKKEIEKLENEKLKSEEGGCFLEEDVESKINEKKKQINVLTRELNDPEHQQYYGLVFHAIDKAKDEIKDMNRKEYPDTLKIWNHFKGDTIYFKEGRYSYKPTTHITWEL
ncbi:MAG: hypothetical protein GY941_23975 [Planctomycetes bacterium]|nr:hypothetical protein [Planctomycetota bacterium]